jgi:hypothetical protein
MNCLKKAARSGDRQKGSLPRSWKDMAAGNIKLTLLSFSSTPMPPVTKTITHLNFIKDTHEGKTEEMEELMTSYDDLGKKINRFISYVQANWKSTRNP